MYAPTSASKSLFLHLSFLPSSFTMFLLRSYTWLVWTGMMNQIPDSITCLVYCTWLQHACNECLLRWLLRMRWPHLRSERQPSMRACRDPSMHTPKRKHANTYDGGCKLKVGKTHGSCFATTCPSPLSPRRGRRAKTCCIIMSSTCGIIVLNYLQYSVPTRQPVLPHHIFLAASFSELTLDYEMTD